MWFARVCVNGHLFWCMLFLVGEGFSLALDSVPMQIVAFCCLSAFVLLTYTAFASYFVSVYAQTRATSMFIFHICAVSHSVRLDTSKFDRQSRRD